MQPSVVRLAGVYDADGTVLGEVSYFLRAQVGRAHCDLCDITHGRIRERSDWRDVRDGLPIPFETFHRDDQPSEVRAAAHGAVPVVVGSLDDGSHLLLVGPAELATCAGSPQRLVEELEAALRRHDLRWPDRSAADA